MASAFVLAPVPLARAPRARPVRGAPSGTKGWASWEEFSQRRCSWQDLEFGLFHHFGMNTFTDREWGDGTEDPALFNPSDLDCRQWARVGREGGARYAILTAKHHDGFCLWPTRTTEHCVR